MTTEILVKSSGGIPWKPLAAIGAKTGLKGVPILGNVLSGGSALHNAAKGNWVSAALDLAGMIPVAGNVLNVGRGVHAAGAALSAARGAGRAAPAAAQTVGKALGGLGARVGKSLPQEYRAPAPFKPKLGTPTGPGQGPRAFAPTPGVTEAPGTEAAPKGALGYLNRYAGAGFGALELMGGNPLMGAAGLATAIPGKFGAIANKWYMPMMLANMGWQALKGGGAAAPEGASAPGHGAPAPAGYPQFKGYSPRNTKEMWNSYMTPYSSLDKERRLAFEAGVERFCKEASFDDEDLSTIYELIKSGSFWNQIDPLGWGWGATKWVGRKAHEAVGGENYAAAAERETAARIEQERRRQAETERAGREQKAAPEYGVTSASGGDLASVTPTAGPAAAAVASAGTPASIYKDRAGIEAAAKKDWDSQMAMGVLSPDKITRNVSRTYGIGRGSKMESTLSGWLSAHNAASGSGAAAGGYPPMQTRWTPPRSGTGAQQTEQTGWTPPPVTPIFGQSADAVDALARSSPGGKLGMGTSAMPSPGNPNIDDKPEMPFGAPPGATALRLSKGTGAVWQGTAKQPLRFEE